MEQTPEIIMRCPKCGKEFELNVVYCEACSVMIEPVEIKKNGPVKQPAAVTVRLDKPPVDSSSSDIVGEKIEDVKIDTLKADIETKFVTTLLLETDQLRKRLTKKEKAFDAMNENTFDTEASSIAKIGQGEAEMDDILKRIARLEAILENLKKKIETDIASLEQQIRSSGKPRAFWFLSGKSRYSKMLSSELQTKRILLDIILKKKSASYFRNRELAKISAGISIVIFLSLLFSWGFFRSIPKQESVSVVRPVIAPPPAPGPAASRPDPKKISISAKDIRLLLEDIRKANMERDFDLWVSRYSKSYLEGRKEGILDQWKKYDCTSLEYQIDNLKISGDTATAFITWDMELFEKNAGWTKTSHTRLLSSFIVENGKLKIASEKRL